TKDAHWLAAAPLVSSGSSTNRLCGFEFFLGHDRTRILALGRGVAIDELDYRDRRCVRRANAGLDDPGVAAVAVGVALGDDVEQLVELCIVHEPRLGEATVRQPAMLGE